MKNAVLLCFYQHNVITKIAEVSSKVKSKPLCNEYFKFNIPQNICWNNFIFKNNKRHKKLFEFWELGSFHCKKNHNAAFMVQATIIMLVKFVVFFTKPF